jgi:hypothetical protein
MNWYKKILLTQKSFEPSSLDYMDIGHDYENLDTNILWVFQNGIVKTMKQKGINGDKYHVDHMYAFPGIDQDIMYSGRFDPITGRLSIMKPLRARFYDIPSKLISRLYEKFPGIKEIHIF